MSEPKHRNPNFSADNPEGCALCTYLYIKYEDARDIDSACCLNPGLIFVRQNDANNESITVFNWWCDKFIDKDALQNTDSELE